MKERHMALLINGTAICLMDDEEKQQYIKQFQSEMRVVIRKLDNEYSSSTCANPANPRVIRECVRDLAYLDRLLSELEEQTQNK
jgi:hypothetical protein